MIDELKESLKANPSLEALLDGVSKLAVMFAMRFCRDLATELNIDLDPNAVEIMLMLNHHEWWHTTILISPANNGRSESLKQLITTMMDTEMKVIIDMMLRCEVDEEAASMLRAYWSQVAKDTLSFNNNFSVPDRPH